MVQGVEAAPVTGGVAPVTVRAQAEPSGLAAVPLERLQRTRIRQVWT